MPIETARPSDTGSRAKYSTERIAVQQAPPTHRVPQALRLKLLQEEAPGELSVRPIVC